MSSGEMIGKQGNKRVSIPLPQIGIPRFRYGKNETGGVGQGDGESGDAVGQPGDGTGPAGNQPGQHAIEAEITLEELCRNHGRGAASPHRTAR